MRNLLVFSALFGIGSLGLISCGGGGGGTSPEALPKVENYNITQTDKGVVVSVTPENSDKRLYLLINNAIVQNATRNRDLTNSSVDQKVIAPSFTQVFNVVAVDPDKYSEKIRFGFKVGSDTVQSLRNKGHTVDVFDIVANSSAEENSNLIFGFQPVFLFQKDGNTNKTNATIAIHDAPLPENLSQPLEAAVWDYMNEGFRIALSQFHINDMPEVSIKTDSTTCPIYNNTFTKIFEVPAKDQNGNAISTPQCFEFQYYAGADDASQGDDTELHLVDDISSNVVGNYTTENNNLNSNPVLSYTFDSVISAGDTKPMHFEAYQTIGQANPPFPPGNDIPLPVDRKIFEGFGIFAANDAVTYKVCITYNSTDKCDTTASAPSGASNAAKNAISMLSGKFIFDSQDTVNGQNRYIYCYDSSGDTACQDEEHRLAVLDDGNIIVAAYALKYIWVSINPDASTLNGGNYQFVLSVDGNDKGDTLTDVDPTTASNYEALLTTDDAMAGGKLIDIANCSETTPSQFSFTAYKIFSGDYRSKIADDFTFTVCQNDPVTSP